MRAPADDKKLDLKEVVEGALDAEDLTPLVRLYFDTIPADRTTRESIRGAEGEQDDRASDSIVVALQQLEDEQTASIVQLCRTNADEIAASLLGLGDMGEQASDLRSRLVEANGALQQAGQGLLGRLTELRELSRAQHAISDTKKAVSEGAKLLQVCAGVSRLLAEGKLYRALKLLERVPPDALLPGSPLTASRPSRGPAGSPSSSSSSPGLKQRGAPQSPSDLGVLQPFVTSRLQQLSDSIEQQALADVKSWLVKVRAEARTVGMGAARRAASMRQTEAALASERKALVTQLPSLASAYEAAAPIAQRLTATKGGQITGAVLDAAAHPAAVQVLSSGAAPAASQGDLLLGIDMTLLHRGVHIHKTLGKMRTFKDYYYSNRRLQLQSDMALPSRFLETYQPFCAQLVGFFVVEERVQRSAPDLASSSQVDVSWDAAVACIKSAVESGLDAITIPLPMLYIKDFLLLCCSTLGLCGYAVAPLQEMLVVQRSRYHDLLSQALQPLVDAIAKTEPWPPLEVTTEAQAVELRDGLGLPLLVHAEAAAPPVPFRAPFTAAIPELLRLARRWVEESSAYLAGLTGMSEVTAMVRQHRDRMLVRVMVDALQKRVEGFRMAGKDPQRRSMQLVADAWAFSQALPALDDHTLVCTRGSSGKDKASKWSQKGSQHRRAASGVLAGQDTPRAGLISQPTTPRPASFTSGGAGNQAIAALQSLQEAGERVVVRVVAGQAGALMSTATMLDWLPDHAPRSNTPSDFVTDIIAFVKDELQSGKDAMPDASFCYVARTLFDFVGKEIMALLGEEAISAFNMFAIFRLHRDVTTLANFAETCYPPGLVNGLAEPVQFCDIMSTARLEELIDPRKRQQSYSAIDLTELIPTLDKYRELSGKTKQPESFLKRRTVDKVIRQLTLQLRDPDLTSVGAM
ncbi:hypothetical protein WJX74_005121 [Apatococcus lobatus]|uniref:Uncharacterized protein n=1 Tax=Apatococcus lobatus TaxID=904363 RepID=A0AAW1RYY4_9CHLO